jgi:hypothetical protein
MATSVEVLQMLIPNGGWIMTGLEYEGIQFLECNPITKKEFEDGFIKYDSWKASQDAKAQAAKISGLAKLAALGLTADEAALLLGGN